MAVAVNHRSRLRAWAWMLGGVLAGLAVTNGAQAMGSAAPFTPPDPATPIAPASTAAPGVTPPEPAPRLTGLRLGRPSTALIDGEWVGLGARVGTSRLVALSPLGARMLYDDGQQEFLPLNPGVHFAPHPPATVRTTDPATVAPQGGRPSLPVRPMKKATP